MKRMIAVAGLVLAAGSSAFGQVLWNNGTWITNPTGGTGTIAGLPISNPESYTVPGNPLTFYTTGVAATVASNTAAADDFTVPAGESWDLSTVTLYAFQTGQTTANVHTIRVNLWTAAPYIEGSPDAPDPLPLPVLAEPIHVAAGTGVLAGHRQGNATSTSTTRAVFAYTISLDGLPNGGLLGPGTYWLEWSFDGALSPSQNVFQPLVTPRDQRTGHNARLRNAIDGSSTAPRVWFEGREGYSAGVSEGRAYELPFILQGTVIPTPTCGTSDFNGDGDFGTDADIEAFFACLGGNCCATCFSGGADFNMDGDTGTDADIESFFRVLGGGQC